MNQYNAKIKPYFDAELRDAALRNTIRLARSSTLNARTCWGSRQRVCISWRIGAC